ncbi:hypothetical protein ACVBE9_06560 [Eionea flava]
MRSRYDLAESVPKEENAYLAREKRKKIRKEDKKWAYIDTFL